MLCTSCNSEEVGVHPTKSQLEAYYDNIMKQTVPESYVVIVSRATPPNPKGEEGLVTSRTTTCVARQDSGATNHIRCFEMRGVTNSNVRYNEATIYATENNFATEGLASEQDDLPIDRRH